MYLKRLQKKKIKAVARIEVIFQSYYSSDKAFAVSFNRSVGKFLDKLPEITIAEAMNLACEIIVDDPERTLRYFCGICWQKIKGRKVSDA